MENFRSDLPDASLNDLKTRLTQTRWPDALADAGWQLGTEPQFLSRFVDHWATRFDWRNSEAELNRLPQFRAKVDGIGIHLVHSRAQVRDARPLLLMNGWPSSIFEYLRIIPLLNRAGFHVVAPALPGYGYSDRPVVRGMNSTRIAALFVSLMEELGYDRFYVHASDMGAGVAEQIRRNYANHVLGVHFSNVYWGYPAPNDPTEDERDYLRRVQQWQFAEGAYAMLQGTKPQTLSYALNDSPAGLAAWVLEKFEAWSDGGVAAFDIDELCANLTLYWATQTIGSSVRLYAEAFADSDAQRPPERGDVPVGVIVFPQDILPAPREWGERWLNLVHWTNAARGGHFPAWEQPEALAVDIQSFAEMLGRR